VYNVKSVKSTELFPAITELLEQNHRVRLTVTGLSMMPFLREGIDSVELSLSSFERLRMGQITLIKRNNGQYILHRLVFKRKNFFYIAGDAQSWIEGPILPEQLVAVVTKIWRCDKPVSPCGVLWNIASFLWWLRLPIIYSIKLPYKFIRRQIRRL
jgi:hypothetical protein